MADEYLTAALYGIRAFNEKTKEKVGMMKLIELLNEYENRDLELEEGEESNARTENNGHLWFNGANKVQFDTYMFDSLALSKKYGFIKWLVENEKIDSGTRNPLFITELVGEQEKQMPYSFYEEMLIRLALSDTPIEDLISYLY